MAFIYPFYGGLVLYTKKKRFLNVVLSRLTIYIRFLTNILIYKNPVINPREGPRKFVAPMAQARFVAITFSICKWERRRCVAWIVSHKARAHVHLFLSPIGRFSFEGKPVPGQSEARFTPPIKVRLLALALWLFKPLTFPEGKKDHLLRERNVF